MKTKLLILTLSLALASFVARAQNSNTSVAFNPVETNISIVENVMQQCDGDIVTHVLIAHSENPHDYPQILGVYVLKLSPTTLQFTDSLFIADSIPPFFLYARDPRGEGNIRANIEPDVEGNTQLRIAHFTDDDLQIDHQSDVVVPLCEGAAYDAASSYLLDSQGNLILKYYKGNDNEVEGHIARYDIEGNMLYDAILPESQNYIRTMEVYKESPLEYCQWRDDDNRNLHFYVLDSTFHLKNYYVISKVINEASSPLVQEYFEFNDSNSNSTFVVPDGEDVLVAARYERFAEGEVPEYGVAAARYNLRTMQRKALVQFNDYPGTNGWANCFGFQKMPDGSVYLLYREWGMPVKYWMTVVKMDSDLHVEWKRYCETPDGMMEIDPFGTEVSIMLEDRDGKLNGFVCSEGGEKGVVHTILTHDGIPTSVGGGIEVRPYMFYPNPAQDRLRLQYSPDVEPAKIELYDLQGRLVRSQGSAFESVDMGQLPTGTYTLRVIMDDGQVFTDKVVKE